MVRELPAPIGQSRPFLELLEQVSRVAPLDRPVLVVGERGTGKELVAERLHFLSGRWDGPLIKLNCAALPETLIESELFGHEAGAFTGAARRRRGRFELADGGTLFLDEIANAGLPVQEKVLRVIEYGELERIGGSETIEVDVRVIAATNADLPSEAAAGQFRHDLLDRLAFDVLTLPPLRERRDDIPVLAEHFGRAMAKELGFAGFVGFSEAALAALEGHGWPGNVRELRNVVERAVAAARGSDTAVDQLVFDPFASPYRPRPITPETSDQAPPGRATGALMSAQGRPDEFAEPDPSTPFDLRARLAAVERGWLEDALAAQRHNQRATARHLGLTYHQLRNALKKHGLLAPKTS
jgi:psp operon transcriptional activator